MFLQESSNVESTKVAAKVDTPTTSTVDTNTTSTTTVDTNTTSITSTTTSTTTSTATSTVDTMETEPIISEAATATATSTSAATSEDTTQNVLRNGWRTGWRTGTLKELRLLRAQVAAAPVQDVPVLVQDVPVLVQDVPVLVQDVPVPVQDVPVPVQDVPVLVQDVQVQDVAAVPVTDAKDVAAVPVTDAKDVAAVPVTDAKDVVPVPAQVATATCNDAVFEAEDLNLQVLYAFADLAATPSFAEIADAHNAVFRAALSDYVQHGCAPQGLVSTRAILSILRVAQRLKCKLSLQLWASVIGAAHAASDVRVLFTAVDALRSSAHVAPIGGPYQDVVALGDVIVSVLQDTHLDNQTSVSAATVLSNPCFSSSDDLYGRVCGPLVAYVKGKLDVNEFADVSPVLYKIMCCMGGAVRGKSATLLLQNAGLLPVILKEIERSLSLTAAIWMAYWKMLSFFCDAMDAAQLSDLYARHTETIERMIAHKPGVNNKYRTRVTGIRDKLEAGKVAAAISEVEMLRAKCAAFEGKCIYLETKMQRVVELVTNVTSASGKSELATTTAITEGSGHGN
jgi:hypothetical protein